MGVNSRVEFMLAPPERLPLADGSTDLVFMSMVLHHLPDKEAVARECCRILRAGFCMRTCTRDIFYHQFRFFPGILPMLKADLPSRLPRSPSCSRPSASGAARISSSPTRLSPG